MRKITLALAVAGVLGASSIAVADIINISATALVLRTEAGSADLVGEEGQGLLQNARGTYFAAVIFPAGGGSVCRFSMVYRDFDSNDITARLLKKTYAIGGSAFTPPVVMATLQTTGSVDAVRRKTATNINQPIISFARTFYYVEVTIPFQALQVMGLEIDFRTTCP